MSATAFRARLVPIKSGGHHVVVTDAVAAAAGVTLRDRVRGTVDGVAYRSSLARYSGEFHVGVQNAVLRAAGAAAGATVAMTIEPDPDPPPGELVPDDLAAAIAASPRARFGFEHMGPAHRREHVKHVVEAVRADTRARRIATTIAVLEAHADEVAAKRAAREVTAKPKQPKPKRRSH